MAGCYVGGISSSKLESGGCKDVDNWERNCLGATTSIPTPFIMVFEIAVADCRKLNDWWLETLNQIGTGAAPKGG